MRWKDHTWQWKGGLMQWDVYIRADWLNNKKWTWISPRDANDDTSRHNSLHVNSSMSQQKEYVEANVCLMILAYDKALWIVPLK